MSARSKLIVQRALLGVNPTAENITLNTIGENDLLVPAVSKLSCILFY